MSRLYNAMKGVKEYMEKVSYEVPTGPHTDVKRRKLNPSFKKKLTEVRKTLPTKK